MKNLWMAAVLVLAPTAYANEAATASDAEILALEESGDTAVDAEMVPPPFGRGVTVRCATGSHFAFGRGQAFALTFQQACNQAASQAFARCSGRFFRGPFRACGGFGRFDTFDDADTFGIRRPGERARFMACMNMRCDVVRGR